MKKFMILVLVLSFSYMQGQRKPKIKGSKIVVEVQDSLPAFNSITLLDDLDIHLVKGNKPSYSLIVDDNLVEVLKFEVVNEVLNISSYYDIRASKSLDIVVFYTDLNSVLLNEGLLLSNDNISTHDFKAVLWGSSKAEMNISSVVLDLELNEKSSGNFNLKADTLNLVVNDRADAELYTISHNVDVALTENASAVLEGTTELLNVHLLEDSKIRAEKLEASKVTLNAEGSPSATINALEEFELTSKDDAKTYLKGNPRISIKEFLDVSELHKIK